MSHKNGNKKVVELKAFNGIPTQPAPIVSLPEVTPLTNIDARRLQEMVDLSNTFASLSQQEKQLDAAIYMMKIKRNDVKTGVIPLPVIIHVTKTLSYAESNKEKVLKHLDDEINGLFQAKLGMKGSLEHRRDEYIETLIRISTIIGKKVEGYNSKVIIGIRPGNEELEKAELKAMEKEFEKIATDDKKEKGG